MYFARPLLLSLLIGMPGTGAGVGPPEVRIDFQQYRYGIPPAEFEYDASGPHGPVLSAGRPLWRTYLDLWAPSPKFVLIQASTLARQDHYPIALLKDWSARDLRLSGWVKAMGGEIGPSGGLLWRARDKDNYYAAVVEARNGLLKVLVTRNGRPTVLAQAPIEMEIQFERRTPLQSWGWYLLDVESVGQRISVWFQRKKVVETDQPQPAQAGRAGLITHADSVMVFDDLIFRIMD